MDESRRLADQLLALVDGRRARFVGVSGPPGAGKTTLANEIVRRRPSTLTMSLDDFYLSKAVRAERGLQWRGPPGSHDLDRLVSVLDALRDNALPIEVPRFDMNTDDRAEPVTVTEPPKLVLLDGFYLGYPDEGYGAITDRLDLLVFLDVDRTTSRVRRFAREETLRAQGGGFTEEEMQRFWDEVLGPGIDRWTSRAREHADVILDAGSR